MTTDYRFISLGEVLEDDIMDNRGEGKATVGGGALSVASQVAQFKVPSYLLSVLGDDDKSKAALDWINKENIHTDYLRTAENKTLLYTRFGKDAYGNDKYVFRQDESNSIRDLNNEDIDKVTFDVTTVLYLSSVACLNDNLFATHLYAAEKAKNSYIVVDPNLREGLYEDDTQLKRAAKLLLKADLIKMSKSELLRLLPYYMKEAKREDKNTHTYGFALHMYFAANPRLKGILVSDAEKGFTFYKRSRQGSDMKTRILQSHQPVIHVDDAKDYIGAGDMAFGAFLGYLLERKSALRTLTNSQIEKAMKHAAIASALASLHQGALPASGYPTIKAFAKKHHVLHL